MISINLIYIVVIGFIIVFTIICLTVDKVCYKTTYMETEEHARNARIRQERISRKQSKEVENDEWI
jgi:hypothetical protein